MSFYFSFRFLFDSNPPQVSIFRHLLFIAFVELATPSGLSSHVVCLSVCLPIRLSTNHTTGFEPWFKLIFGVAYMAFGLFCIVVFFRAREVFEIRARWVCVSASLPTTCSHWRCVSSSCFCFTSLFFHFSFRNDFFKVGTSTVSPMKKLLGDENKIVWARQDMLGVRTKKYCTSIQILCKEQT